MPNRPSAKLITVKLATFNMMSGRTVADGVVDPGRVEATIGRLDADILALQEVDRDQPRSHRLDLAALSARALSVPDDGYRFTAAITGTPGEVWRAARPDDGQRGPQYGIALLSRRPVSRWLVRRLPAAPLRSPVLIPGPGGGWRRLPDEPRVVLAAVLDGLTVACTHLSFLPGWNLYQLGLVLRWLARLPGPQVLLGDLNLPLALTRTVGGPAGWHDLVRAPTYPAWRPRFQLDHILWHGRRPRLRGVDAARADISDHHPLVVDLAGPAGAGPGWDTRPPVDPTRPGGPPR